MTEIPDYAAIIHQAEAATNYARMVREHHRRRTTKTNHQRQADIEIALDRLKRAMQPLRVYMGIGSHGGVNVDQLEAVRKASRRMQSERRKLWKMRKGDKK